MEDEVTNRLRMHRCTIEKVYPSGLIDAHSSQGQYHERINLLFNGVEGSYSVNDQVIVLTDGAQSFAIGLLPDTKTKDDGSKSIHRFENDIVDWNESKVIAVEDAFETQSRVIVAPGGGIMIDTGEWCMTHYDPGLAKIIDYIERKEVITPAHHAKLDHNGVTASAHYEWRTQPSGVAMDQTLMGLGGGGLIPNFNPRGHKLAVDIEEGVTNVVSVFLKRLGSTILNIGISRLGSFEMYPISPLNPSSTPVPTSYQSTSPVQQQTIEFGFPNSSGINRRVAIGPYIEAKINQMVTKYAFHGHTYIMPLIPSGVSISAPPTTPQTPVLPFKLSSKNVKAYPYAPFSPPVSVPFL